MESADYDIKNPLTVISKAITSLFWQGESLCHVCQ